MLTCYIKLDLVINIQVYINYHAYMLCYGSGVTLVRL